MELKPCPFCGYQVEHSDNCSSAPRFKNVVFYAVKCPRCKIMGPSSATTYKGEESMGLEEMFEKSAKAWNARASQ